VIASAPLSGFSWHPTFSRVCKSEWEELQGDSRHFALTKVSARLEPVLLHFFFRGGGGLG